MKINTIIIFMSDHGYNFGEISQTPQGFYEGSLPFFYLRLPEELKMKYPEWAENLRRNVEKLTTPYDLHETLSQVLVEVKKVTGTGSSLGDDDERNLRSTLNNPVHKQRYSFFEFIPENRTCEEASIPWKFCMCGVNVSKTMSSNSTSISFRLGVLIISKVNFILQSVIREGKCARLEYSKLIQMREISKGESCKDYLVVVEAYPSLAKFEGRLRVANYVNAKILGSVNRLDEYKEQSKCMTDNELTPYCFCIK